jgi:hypothetical protein
MIGCCSATSGRSLRHEYQLPEARPGPPACPPTCQPAAEVLHAAHHLAAAKVKNAHCRQAGKQRGGEEINEVRRQTLKCCASRHSAVHPAHDEPDGVSMASGGAAEGVRCRTCAAGVCRIQQGTAAGGGDVVHRGGRRGVARAADGGQVELGDAILPLQVPHVHTLCTTWHIRHSVRTTDQIRDMDMQELGGASGNVVMPV